MAGLFRICNWPHDFIKKGIRFKTMRVLPALLRHEQKDGGQARGEGVTEKIFARGMGLAAVRSWPHERKADTQSGHGSSDDLKRGWQKSPRLVPASFIQALWPDTRLILNLLPTIHSR